MPEYGQIESGYLTRIATTAPEDDGPVWMINLLRYKEHAVYVDGRETTLTGREAHDLSAPHGPMAEVGAEVVFVADVEDQLVGDPPNWDRIVVVKHQSRASFQAMFNQDGFEESHAHKEAGTAQTIVIGGQPMSFPSSDIPLADWADVPHPSTEDDGPYTTLRVIRFTDAKAADVTPERMKRYQEVAGSVAVPQGIRVSGWFSVEGTIIGDGRAWDQVRFNTFPSRAAFMAVMTDPTRLEAEVDHREAAIADIYELGVRPVINTLADSISSAV